MKTIARWEGNRMNDISQEVGRIAELSAEELEALKERIIAEYQAVKESEPTREVVEQMQELAAAAQAVKAENERRAAEAAELAAAAEEAGNSIAALETPEESEAEVEVEEAATDTNTDVDEE